MEKRQFSGVDLFTGVISSIIGGIVLLILPLASFQNLGSPWFISAAWVLIALSLYLTIYYWKILGYGNSENQEEFKQYVRLRSEIHRIGPFRPDVSIGTFYNERVSALMRRVDRYYGDAHVNSDLLGPKWISLNDPKPIWTVQSFDRCLYLAALYPFVAVLLIWAVYNQIGPTEASIGLTTTGDLQRLLVIISIFFAALCLYISFRSNRIKAMVAIAGVFFFAFVLHFDFAGAFSGPYPGPSIIFFAIAIFVGCRGVSGGFGVILVGVIIAVIGISAIAIVDAISSTADGAGAVALAQLIGLVVAFVVVSVVTLPVVKFILFKHIFIQRGWQYCLLTLCAVLAIVGLCLSSEQETWAYYGPFSFFFFIVTIINAPFDWFSLGITRLLVHKGLEQRGWKPAFYGIIDIVLAMSIMVCLSICFLIALQAFNALTLVGGGEVFLEPTSYMAAFGDPEQRLDPQYYWVYVMVFSTMVPSVVNITIGLLSITRGFAPIYMYIKARKLPAKNSVPEANRMLFAPMIALNRVMCFFGGIALSIAAIIVITKIVLPWFGLNLYNIAQHLTDANYPARLIDWIRAS